MRSDGVRGKGDPVVMFYQSLQHVRCKGCQPDMRRRRVPVGARKSGDRPMRRQRWSGSACSKEGGSEISSDSASIRPCWICPRGQSVREPTVSEFSTFRSKTNVRPLPFDRTAPAHVTTRPPIHCTVHPQATLPPSVLIWSHPNLSQQWPPNSSARSSAPDDVSG